MKAVLPICDGAYLATGCRDENIRIWCMSTDKCINTVKGHFDEVSSLALIGSTLWSGSLDATVRSWDLKGIFYPLGAHSSYQG